MALAANVALAAAFITSVLFHCDAAPVHGAALEPRSDSVEPLNEPCYVHDAACDGYSVCCVTKGTCKSKHSGMLSSNTAYYEGGCQSKESRNPVWSNPSCTQQGECMVKHLETCFGATTKAGQMTELPEATLNRMTEGMCGTECYQGSTYRHGGGGGDGTGAPTATVTEVPTPQPTSMSHMSGTFTLAVSDVSAASQTADFNDLITKAVKVLMGYHDKGWIPVTVTVPAVAAEMKIEYEVELDSLWKVTTDKLTERMASVTYDHVNKLFADMIGCSSYTVTVTHNNADTLWPPTPPPTPKPTESAPPVSTANRMLLSSSVAAIIVAAAAMLLRM